VASARECGIERSGPAKCGEFLDRLLASQEGLCSVELLL